ncbi:MAG: DAK2 domain-containing protein [Chloroflexales bacterium]|nr:DAK2 domain-containing protein [Chloroflexales bacterium]
MTTVIEGAQIASTIRRVADRLIAIADWLNQLDAAMGDGDTGVTISKGAEGLRQHLDANPPGDDLGKWLAGVGTAFNKAAPSTIAALTATALMRAGKEARGVSALDAALLTRMLRAADEGVQERGKAKPGDKTIVDALHPAANAFAEAIAQDDDLRAAALAMIEASRAGRDAVIPLRSKIGRAGWVGERTEGQPDPGTVLLVQVLETIAGVEYSEPGSTLKA